jgi:hypothetical protein
VWRATSAAGIPASLFGTRVGLSPPPAASQLRDCGQDAPPDLRSIEISVVEQLVGALGGPERRVFAVPVDISLAARKMPESSIGSTIPKFAGRAA